MSEHEGLNLPQLLELLHPIVMADAVSLWPVAAGWWVVALWLAALALLGGWQLRARWVKNAYRRDALAELAHLGGQPGSAAAIAAVLKRTALAAFPREQVASLTGPQWARFLEETSGNDELIAGASDMLAAAAYQMDAEPAALMAPARRWVKVHRA